MAGAKEEEGAGEGAESEERSDELAEEVAVGGCAHVE